MPRFPSVNATSRLVFRHGYSMVEMVVVLAILAVLAAAAIPSMAGALAALRVQLASQAFVQGMALTRSEAILRNARVVMCKSRSGVGCEAAAGWEAGWLIFQDTNNNGQRDAEDVLVLRHDALGGTLRIYAKNTVANYLSYTGLGTTRTVAGALQLGSFVVCDPSAPTAPSYGVVVGGAGRPRSIKYPEGGCALR